MPRLAEVTGYAAGGGTLIAGLSISEIGVVAGILIGLATLCINTYFRCMERRDRLGNK